jgi:heme/copper-type cytochrome/quinol oxidase subunit 1
MLFAVGFLVTFTIGGLSGISFATFPVDWQVTDTYYLVAHIHYVLFGGTAFAVFAGVYYWFPKISGRMLSEPLGKLHFWLMLVGFNMTFLVQHFLGLMGMPRRMFTYPNLPGWAVLNMISSIGAGIMAIAVAIFVWNIIASSLHGMMAGDNPWNGWTLEWATTSPPPVHNFDLLPPIRSRRPLWDVAHPENPDWKHGH